MTQEVVIEFGAVVVGVVVHECQGEGGQGVVAFVERAVVGLDDGRVVGGELNEVDDDVGQEYYEEEGSADEGLASRDGVVFRHWDEAEDIYLSEGSQADVGLLLADEGLLKFRFFRHVVINELK